MKLKKILNLFKRSEFENSILKYNLITKCILLLIYLFFQIYVDDQHDFKNMMEFTLNISEKENNRLLNKFLYILMGLTKWDGSMFLDIIQNGYSDLNTRAFFPGYPAFVYILTYPIRIFINNNLILLYISFGIIVNITLHLINNLLIYR